MTDKTHIANDGAGRLTRPICPAIAALGAAAVALALIVLAASCQAQTLPPVGVRGPSTTPVAPVGPAVPAAAPSALQASPAESNDITVEAAVGVRVGQNDVVTATGDVRVQYHDYTLYSDQATIDTHSGIATFEGHVHLDSQDQSTSFVSLSPDTKLVLNLRNGSYAIHGPEHGVINPNLFPGSGLLLPLRVDTSDVTSDGNVIDARSAGFTTCDFTEPHYLFGVGRLTIIPGKRLIARNAVLYRRGHRLFELREVVLPLNDRYENSNIIPTIGDDPQEGYFAKFNYPYVLAALATGVIHLDYMQREGIGTGFDQNYVAHGSGGGGLFSLYHLDDAADGLQEFTGSLSHQQSIGSFRLGIDSQFENNSTYSALGSSENLTNRITLSQSTKLSQTLFTSTVEQSDFGAGLSSNISSSLDQNQIIGRNESVSLKLGYSSFTTPGFSSALGGSTASSSSTSGTLSTDIALHMQPSGLKIDAEANTFSTFSSSSSLGLFGGFGGLERRPELMLTTTGVGSDPLDRVAELLRGSQLQFGLGSYFETESHADTSRMLFGYDTGVHEKQYGSLRTDADSSFQQSFYGDGGARYILNGKYDSTYDMGQFKLGAGYTTLRAYGYTPFFFDQAGDYNNANFSVTYASGKAFDLEAETAYDFLRDQGEFGLPAAPWENLLAVADYHPNPNLVNRLQATYDPNHGTLYDVTNDFQAKDNEGFGLHVAWDFIAQEHQFGAVNGSLDLPIVTDQKEQSGYKVQLLAGYDGLTNQFTYQGVSLTRSWHDWELSGTFENNPEGIPAGRTFYLTFHLKAFPAYQPFGVGAYGQGMASGIGQVY